MPPRLSFKPDSSFFRKIAIGAVGARSVCNDLQERGHEIFELENGSIDTKIWKDVKRKRVRIPDLICVNCGLRFESRAKTKPDLSMSHSSTDAERAWDYGMVDTDIIAFPISQSANEVVWSRGQLLDNQTYWHKQGRIKWITSNYINYVQVGAFRKVLHSRSSTKGVIEGLETSIVWDAIFSTRNGEVKAINDGKISVRRIFDGHLYTWQNKNNLPIVVNVGDVVHESQILASSIHPLKNCQLGCPGDLPSNHIHNLLTSPERTQRFSGIKLSRLRRESGYEEIIERIRRHPEEDIYVQLEGAIYLSSVCGQSSNELIGFYLDSADEQIHLESIVALAEASTKGSVILLSRILDQDTTPFFLRSAAAWALGRIGSDQAIQRLIQAFSDIDQSIREEALEAVYTLGEPALRHLLSGLVDNEQSVAAGSAEALRRQVLLPPDVVRSIIQGIESDPTNLWSVWLLGNLRREKEYITSAIAELQDSQPEVHYAISVLWTFIKSWIALHWELNPTAREDL